MGERIGNIETPKGDGNIMENLPSSTVIIGNIEIPKGDGNGSTTSGLSGLSTIGNIETPKGGGNFDIPQERW